MLPFLSCRLPSGSMNLLQGPLYSWKFSCNILEYRTSQWAHANMFCTNSPSWPPPSRSYPDYGMVAQTKDGQILSLAWHFTTWMRIQFFLPKKCEKTKIPAKRSAEKYKSLSTPRRFAFSHFGSSDAAMKRTCWPTWLYLNLIGFHATQHFTKNWMNQGIFVCWRKTGECTCTWPLPGCRSCRQSWSSARRACALLTAGPYACRWVLPSSNKFLKTCSECQQTQCCLCLVGNWLWRGRGHF